MKRLLIIGLPLALVLAMGCAMRTRYVEGTSIALGAYIPWDGNLYGTELISYLNGISVSTTTNKLLSAYHYSSSTNKWLWGMMESTTTTRTKVEEKNGNN